MANDVKKALEEVDAEIAAEDSARSVEMANTYNEPSQAEIDQIEQEIQLEEQYGSSPLQAGAEGLLRGATMGLSDPILESAGVSEEGLRERAKRSALATTGEVAGTVAGLLTPVGPLAATVKAGQTAERATAKAISKLLQGTGRSNSAKKIAEKATQMAAQGATEGAIFGAANIANEASLGNAELTAENILGSVGHGAALGGVLNVGLGGAASAVPTIARGAKPLSDRLKKGAERFTGRAESAKQLIGLTPKDIVQLEKRNPKIIEELPDFLQYRVGLKATDSIDDIAAKNAALKSAAGKQIDKLIPAIDDALVNVAELLPSRAKLYQEQLDLIDDHLGKLSLTPKANAAEIGSLKRYRADIVDLGAQEVPVSFLELNNLRKLYDKKAKFNPMGTPAQNFASSVASELRSIARNQLDDLAELASTGAVAPEISQLAQSLKRANKDYSLASTIHDKLLMRAEKGPSLLNHGRVVEALLFTGLGGPAGVAALATKEFLQSDLRRKMVILSDMHKMTDTFSKRMKTSTDKFVSVAKRGAKVPKAASLRAIIGSMFAKDVENKKEPKNKREAFKNASANLIRLQTDPDELTERLAKSTAVIGVAAPETSKQIHEKLLSGIEFLVSKLPKSAARVEPVLNRRTYEPSDSELAKFERYLQIVESPATIFEEMEAGTITREHVEALRVVYPKIYAMLQADVMTALTAMEEPLPYSKRLQIGLLLDLTTDESLVPENIAALQANFSPAPAPEAPPQSAVKPTVGAMSDLNMAGREASMSTAVIARRQG